MTKGLTFSSFVICRCSLRRTWFVVLAHPFEDGRFHFRELIRAQRSQLANRPGSRIRGDALRDEGALLEKWDLYRDLKLGSSKRGRVKDYGHDRAVIVRKRDAENENRPDFFDHAAIPQPDLAPF